MQTDEEIGKVAAAVPVIICILAICSEQCFVLYFVLFFCERLAFYAFFFLLDCSKTHTEDKIQTRAC